MKKLYEAIDRDTSLEQMELLVFRPVFAEHSSVTLSDLLESTLEFTLKVNEFLDIKECIEERLHKEMEDAQKSNMPRGGRR